MDEFGLYTGCLIRARMPHLEKSARAVFGRLGIRLSEPDGVSCCPEPGGMRGVDQDAWLTVAARNLSLLGAGGRSSLVLCSGCHNTFREAEHLLATNTGARERVTQALKSVGCAYGTARVEHFAQFLCDRVDPKRFASSLVRSWKGLPVAVHYGCHALKPSELLRFDDPENPTKLDRLCRVLGSEPLDYARKTLCCGLPVQGVDDDLSLLMGAEKLRLMHESGARAVVVICPSCMLQFDLKQRLLEAKAGVAFRLPVFYLTEFIGLAMGFSPASLGLHLHRVDPLPLVREIFPEADEEPGHAPAAASGGG